MRSPPPVAPGARGLVPLAVDWGFGTGFSGALVMGLSGGVAGGFTFVGVWEIMRPSAVLSGAGGFATGGWTFVGVCEIMRPIAVFSCAAGFPAGPCTGLLGGLGTMMGWPQPRHVDMRPAHSSGADATVRQWGHAKENIGDLHGRGTEGRHGSADESDGFETSQPQAASYWQGMR
jgi:hypothetical protein